MEPQNDNSDSTEVPTKREYRVPTWHFLVILVLLGLAMAFQPIEGEWGWVVRGFIASGMILAVILVAIRFKDSRKTVTPVENIIPHPPAPTTLEASIPADVSTAPSRDDAMRAYRELMGKPEEAESEATAIPAVAEAQTSKASGDTEDPSESPVDEVVKPDTAGSIPDLDDSADSVARRAAWLTEEYPGASLEGIIRVAQGADSDLLVE